MITINFNVHLGEAQTTRRVAIRVGWFGRLYVKVEGKEFALDDGGKLDVDLTLRPYFES